MESETNPQVSVVIPSYNHEAYVREALESVLKSSVSHLEVIVVDDGSTDRSVDVIQRCKDSRVKLIRQENLGAHAAINRGLEAASAPWVAVLNSDDRFHPKKLQQHLELHERDPALEASACRVRYVSALGKPLPESTWRVWRYRKAVASARQCDSLFDSLLAANHLVTTSSLFVRRDVIKEIGGFPPLRYVHDWFVFLGLAARRGLAVIEDELVDYRRHPTNTIAENDAMGRVEDNFVLDWHCARALAAKPPLMEMADALRILDGNRRVSYRLMLLFRFWRDSNENDLGRAASLFLTPNHPVVRSALDIVAAEESMISPKRLLRRLLGQKAIVAADWAARGMRYAEKLALTAKRRNGGS